jgi:hypothetical protein
VLFMFSLTQGSKDSEAVGARRARHPPSVGRRQRPSPSLSGPFSWGGASVSAAPSAAPLPLPSRRAHPLPLFRPTPNHTLPLPPTRSEARSQHQPLQPQPRTMALRASVQVGWFFLVTHWPRSMQCWDDQPLMRRLGQSARPGAPS